MPSPDRHAPSPIGSAPGAAGQTAARWRAVARGYRIMVSAPAGVLFASSIGYGALAHDTGLSAVQAVLMTAIVFALPAQVVMIDQLARGAALAAAVFAVTLTAVRLLPMTVVIVPYFRADPGPRWLKVFAVHFIAITAWIEAQRWLPAEPPALRLPFFIGIGLAMTTATLTGSLLGHQLAGAVPQGLSAALLLATPLYFLLSLLGTARLNSEVCAIGLGAVIGPLVFVLAPGLDLLVAGIVGGTIAWLAGRRERSRA